MESAAAPPTKSPSPRGRPHRRGRGRIGSLKKAGDGRLHGHALFTANGESVASRASGVSPSASATPPSTSNEAARQCNNCLARAGGKGPRHGWGEGSGNRADAYHLPVATSSVLPQSSGAVAPHVPSSSSSSLSAPPPLPAVVLPAWCRSASAVAYPLSEDGLTIELVDFYHYLQLTSQERAARERLLHCIEAGVRTLWSASLPEQTAQVSLYGSYALGLSLPSSDIDLVLTFPSEEKAEAEERRQRECRGEGDDSPAAVEAAKRRQLLHLERLHALAEHLRGSTNTLSLPLQVEVYDQCRIPRIHLRDTSPGGVSCDINSSLTSDRVARIVSRQQRWLKDSPLAAFLVRVTKAAVKQWDLNEVFAGGLASTALYCLVLRFLAQAEQLHRHTKLEEENLSPPRYDEATQSVSSLSASLCGSPLSPSSPTTTTTTTSSVSAAPLTGATAQTSSSPSTTFVAASAAAAVAAAPSYVPSWLLSGKRHAGAASASTMPATEEGGMSSPSLKTCASGPWAECGSRSSTCSDREHSGEEDAEVDALTQEALTCTSCATTSSTTPTSRTATNTPPSPPASSRGSAVLPSTQSATSGAEGKRENACTAAQHRTSKRHATCMEDSISAEELTRMAQARYGASPARLLLKLWRSLSADTFLSGYHVADVFGDDAAWATSELAGFSGRPAAQPGSATLELATYACRSSTDLSAPSFRLPDLLALFRCSGSSLDNMLRFQRYPRRMAPTMLSTIFVDPRMQAEDFQRRCLT